MPEEKHHIVHVIHGTIPPDEWKQFFKKHFVPGPPGEASGPFQDEAAKTTGSCEDYGCPHTHGGGAITGCEVTITRGRVVSVMCHYEVAKRS